jgi:hypothetical protein
MANTVIAIRSSGVTGNTPSLGVLANGELSLNFADGILYYKSAANTLGSIRTAQPSGLNQEIQFNDSGSFGANAAFTFNKSTGVFTAPIVASSNNGTGQNFKVGDDAWIGDVNQADTLRISGQQNSANAYIIFGSSDTTKLGRAGTGALTYGGAFTATGTVSGNELSSTQSAGDEGGQVNLAIPATNTSLTGQVTIDIFQNKLRFFQGDSAKGAYIDLTAAAAGVGSNLLAGGMSGVTSVAGATGAVSNNQILSGLLTVDGSGSGLDADLLDGQSSSYYATDTKAQAAFDKANTDVTSITATAGVYGNATHVPVITLSANGRVSSITNTAISGGGGSSANGFGVIYTPNNSTYANATIASDAITFVGEAGVYVGSNAISKTITFAGSPGAQGLTVDYGYVYDAINYSIDYGTL